MANTGNTQQQIDYGSQPNDGLGDPLRTAFIKTDQNFDNIWLAGPVGSNITIGNNTIQTNNTNGNLVLKPNGIGIIQANAHIIPSANNARDLGSVNSAWRRAYINTLTTQNLEVPGDMVVGGNLTVEGDTIQIGNIVTDTLTIQLANTAANGAQANGAGITVGANDDIATFLYDSNQDRWVTNIGVAMPDIVVNSIRSDDSSFVSIQDGLYVDGPVDATGTISAPYFVGNGSQLSGMYGNTNVAAYLPVYSGNIGSGAGYVFGNGSQLTGMYGNTNVAAYLPTYTGNLSAGRLDVNNGNWIIQGNSIYAPSGGEWYSDPDTLDDFITSAANGYINLQSLFASGNIASELHLEHGIAQIRVADSPFQEWTFRNTGTLEAPGNIDVDGNVNTTNTVFTQNLDISKTGNTWYWNGALMLSPAGGSWYSNPDVQEEYISSGEDGYLTLQSLGAGPGFQIESEINLEHGKVRIGVFDGTNKHWDFLEDGTMTAPGDILPQANSTQSLGNVDFQWANLWVANNTIYIGGVPLGIGVGNVLTVGGEPILSNDSNTSITTTGNITADYFIGDGSQLTGLLDGTAITNGTSTIDIPVANGNIYVGVDNVGSTEFTQLGINTLNLSTLGNVTATGNISATGNVSGDVGLFNDINLNNAGTNRMLYVDGDRNIYDTDFSYDSANGAISGSGNISAGYFIGDGSLLTGLPASYSDSNVVTLLSNFGSNTISTTGNVTAGNFVGSGTNVDIVAGSYEWTFANDGNLTLPGNTFAVNYANGTAVSLGGNYGNANVATFLASFGSNTIVTTGNITAGNFSGNISVTGNVTGTSANVDLVAGSYTWSFNNTGNLVLPGNVFAVQYANGTTVALGGGGGTYGDSNVVSLMSAFGSNTIVTTGNITGGNLIASGAATTGVNSLLAGPTFTPLANTAAGFVANVNSYSQITFQNKNAGADATADYILTADNGSDTVNYGDFGIINSGYDINTPTNSLGNIVRAGDTYLYAQGNVSNTSQSGGNLVIGTTTATKNVKIFAGGANNSALIANISNTGVAITGTLSTTGNITTANITGSSANVTITANAYVTTFDTTGLVTFPGNIVAGGGGIINKASGFVNAGTFVTLDNIRATVTAGGNRGLSLATVSGSITVNIAATYGGVSGPGGASAVDQTYTTTPSSSVFGWNFGVAGEVSTYNISDITNALAYRITLQIGPSYNNNFVSIERL